MIGDKRVCVHCGKGLQILREFDLHYNVWVCTGKKCKGENLQEKQGGK